jgi:hypothetical protein
MDEWTPFQQAKPTTEQIEDYMKSLNLPEKQEKYDPVDRPKHYMLFEPYEISQRADYGLGIEVRNVLEKLAQKLQNSQGPTGTYHLFESDYVQMMQYLMRFMDKNGVEDLKKASWYLDKMIEAY